MEGTILVADSDFGDLEIERSVVEGAGFRLVAAQCKTEDEVIAHGRDADGVLTQYAPVRARAIDAFTRCRVIAPLQRRLKNGTPGTGPDRSRDGRGADHAGCPRQGTAGPW